MSSLFRPRNDLLQALSPADFGLLQPHLREMRLVHDDLLVEAGSPIRSAYFPHDGIISLVVRLATGDAVEAAMVGRDGVFGTVAALDGRISLNAAIVQMAGVASTVDVSALRAVAAESETLRALMLRHEQVICAQALQSAACNAAHSVQERLSRWLLRARDLSGQDTLGFTQELIAQMLGAQRNTVSIVANSLQQAGIIRYRRGRIDILDLQGLRENACECYGTIQAHYYNMLHAP